MSDKQELYTTQTKDILLQNCSFRTNMTAVTVVNIIGSRLKFSEFNLRVAHSSFSLYSSDPQTKVIRFKGEPQLTWMLWKAKFQINSYNTISGDKNFTKNLHKIVSYDPGETLFGTISETQYASGNRFFTFNCKCGMLATCVIKEMKEIFVRLILAINLPRDLTEHLF